MGSFSHYARQNDFDVDARHLPSPSTTVSSCTIKTMWTKTRAADYGVERKIDAVRERQGDRLQRLCLCSDAETFSASISNGLKPLSRPNPLSLWVCSTTPHTAGRTWKPGQTSSLHPSWWRRRRAGRSKRSCSLGQGRTWRCATQGMSFVFRSNYH